MLQIRGPHIADAVLIGAALSVAGTAFQGLFRNPLVSPDILGVSAGASLGAILGIFLSLPVLAIQLCAFVGGLAAVAVVYGLGARIRGHDPILVLVLAGIALTTLPAPTAPAWSGWSFAPLRYAVPIGLLVWGCMGVDFPESNRRMSRLA